MKINQWIGCTVVVALLVSMSSFAAEADAPISIGAGLDVGWRGNTYNTDNAGFVFNEGALYFSKKIDKHDVLIDLAFATSTGDTSVLEFSMSKSQAYFSSSWGGGFKSKFGIWDGLFGYEGADPWDRRFAQAGSMGFLTIGSSNNLGLQLGYEFAEGKALTVYAANPTPNYGKLGDRNYEFGAQFNLDFKGPYLTLGGYVQKDKNFTTNSNNSLLNVIAGNAFGAVKVDVEYNKRAYAGTDQGTTGIGAHLGYTMSESVEMGARFEQVTQASLAGDLKMTGITVGPQWTFAKDTKLRAEYMYASFSPTPVVGPETVGSYQVGICSRF